MRREGLVVIAFLTLLLGHPRASAVERSTLEILDPVGDANIGVAPLSLAGTSHDIVAARIEQAYSDHLTVEVEVEVVSAIASNLSGEFVGVFRVRDWWGGGWYLGGVTAYPDPLSAPRDMVGLFCRATEDGSVNGTLEDACFSFRSVGLNGSTFRADIPNWMMHASPGATVDGLWAYALGSHRLRGDDPMDTTARAEGSIRLRDDLPARPVEASDLEVGGTPGPPAGLLVALLGLLLLVRPRRP